MTSVECLSSLAIAEAVTGLSGFARSSCFEVIAAGDGSASIRVRKSSHLTQFNGYFHGGVIAGLADHAAGAAATSSLPAGKTVVTAAMSVSYLSPASAPLMLAQARTVCWGRTLCTVLVQIFELETESSNPGNVLAVATATLRVIPLPPF
jgi:uncharacterized protein (TIGR00369 family)